MPFIIPGTVGAGVKIGGDIIGSLEKHYPKTIRMEDEPYITQHSYWKHVVGMTDFEATLLVWSANSQPLSPADRTALEAAIKKVQSKGVLPSFDSYAADPNRHTMAAAIAHRTIFDDNLNARSGFPETRGTAPTQNDKILSKLDAPIAAASVGGFPFSWLLIAGLVVGVGVMARK